MKNTTKQPTQNPHLSGALTCLPGVAMACLMLASGPALSANPGQETSSEELQKVFPLSGGNPHRPGLKSNFKQGSMYHSCLTFKVLSSNNESLPHHMAHSERVNLRGQIRKQSYIEGNLGAAYQLYFKNNCSARVKTVISVDGLNVLNGKSASSQGMGYILEPGKSMVVAGWRKSNDEVAQFYFSTIPDSYSNRALKGIDNLGIIGVAAYFEKAPLSYFRKSAPYDHYGAKSEEGHAGRVHDSSAGAALESRANPTASKSIQNLQNNKERSALGTGHGQRIQSEAVAVEFESQLEPFAVLSAKYDSSEGLEAKGIKPKKPSFQGPQAFPEDAFAADPVLR